MPVEATLVVKGTFEQDSDRRWRPIAEQIPILDDRLETPFGIFHGENFTRKDGVDLCVMGTVRPARPMRGTQVRIAVGAHRKALTVFGDRRWARAGSQLVPSAPQDFVEMPLAYSRAYGGATVHDYENVVWPDNPVGRGYYLSEAAADGKPLPNVELADGPQVRAWSDQPTVAGWAPYPCFWGLRAREGVKPPDAIGAASIGQLKPRLNNNAHPELILPKLDDDTEIRIAGLQAVELVYQPPPFIFRLEVEVAAQIIAEPPATVDGVFIWTDLGRITLTARAHFNYSYNRGEIRKARLLPGA
ncbi:MAG: hypothetical protein QOI66_98 [Myxococcales bacterium]|nr:hypothetical protein [Myxococcales bacterium]